jgi:hypothetical protein
MQQCVTDSGDVLYQVDCSGEHVQDDQLRPYQHGLNPVLMGAIDSMLKNGIVPSKVAAQLSDVLKDNPAQAHLLDALPDEPDVLYKKIVSRKKQISNGHNNATEHELNLLVQDRSVSVVGGPAAMNSRIAQLVADVPGGEDALIVLTGADASSVVEMNSYNDNDSDSGSDGDVHADAVPDPVPNQRAAGEGASDGASDSGADDRPGGCTESDADAAGSKFGTSGDADPDAALLVAWDASDISEGFIFSSAAILRNIGVALRDLHPGIHLAIDGTYKILMGPWVLLVLATHTVNMPTSDCGRGSESTHTAVPLLFSIVKSESGRSVSALVHTLQLLARNMFGVDVLSVRSVSMDRSNALRCGIYRRLGTQVKIVNCFAHLVRKSKDKARTFKCKPYYESTIKVDIAALHLCPSEAALVMLADLALSKWDAAGHPRYASWFRKIYMGEGWRGWWVGAAGGAGAGASNNPLEAYNKEIKVHISARSTMAHFLANNVHNLLRAARRRRTPTSMLNEAQHKQKDMICMGSIPRPVIAAAQELIAEPCEYQKTCEVLHPDRVHWHVNASGSRGVAVTMQRIQTRKALCTGTIPDADFAECYTAVMSMHTVSVINSTAQELDLATAATARCALNGSSSGVISSAASTAAVAREGPIISDPFYRCECKGYMTSGFLCSHVLAAYHLDKLLDLKKFAARFEGPVKNGRPLKRTAALVAMEPAATSAGGGDSNGPADKRLRGLNMVGAWVRGCGAFHGLRSGVVLQCKGDVYTVSFPDAEPPCTGDLSATDVVQCYKAQLSFALAQKPA